jgi:Uma2 family endonuclease
MTLSVPTAKRSPHARCPRPFVAGTVGWSVEDLDDPRIERQWEAGRFEIVEGVLTTMPAAYRDGTRPPSRLRRIVERHLDHMKLPGEFTNEDDLVVNRRRVVRVDLMFMTPEDEQRQERANAERGRPKLRFGRVLIPPTLIVESVSPGHEEHDRATKRQWFAEAQVPHYWILDAYQRSLECLVLDGTAYRTDQTGKDAAELRPTLFPGLDIPLGELWK